MTLAPPEPRLACPDCRAPLPPFAPTALRCGRCESTFGLDANGFPDLRPRVVDELQEEVVRLDERAYADLGEREREESTFGRQIEERVYEILIAAHARLLEGSYEERIVLDAGCGPGYFLRRIAPMAARYVGVDLGSALLADARRTARDLGLPAGRVTLLRGSVLALPFEEESFDAVLSSEVLEHVPQPLTHLAEIRRVLRSGGRATVSTPNGWMHWFPYPRNVARLVFRRRSALRALFPEHFWREALPHHPAVRPGVLERWCREAGLRVLAHRFMQWNYWSELRLTYRTLAALERLGFPSARVGLWLLDLGERALARRRWLRVFASRQVVLVERPG